MGHQVLHELNLRPPEDEDALQRLADAVGEVASHSLKNGKGKKGKRGRSPEESKGRKKRKGNCDESDDEDDP
jgi:hypothetical protein